MTWHQKTGNFGHSCDSLKLKTSRIPALVVLRAECACTAKRRTDSGFFLIRKLLTYPLKLNQLIN